MKCRWLVCFCVLVAISIVQERAFADAEAIPTSWKEEIDPSSHKAEMQSRIQTELAGLADAAGAGSARNWLRDGAEVANNNALTSPGYRQLYVQLLNQKFVQLLNDPKTTVRLKVNIAIVSQLVCDRAKSSALFPTVVKLLGDKSDPVVLWGEKAAASLLPAMIADVPANPDLNKLFAAIGKSVSDHGGSLMAGDIAQEAFNGINPSVNPSMMQSKVDLTQVYPQLVKCNLDLRQARLALYKGGSNAAPDSPEADTYPSQFLLTKDNWPKLTDADKLRAVQQSIDLISLAAQRMAKRNGNDTEELQKTIRDESYYFQDIARTEWKNADLNAALAAMHSISVGTRPDAIESARAALYPALKAVADSTPYLADLKAPPDLNAPG